MFQEWCHQLSRLAICAQKQARISADCRLQPSQSVCCAGCFLQNCATANSTSNNALHEGDTSLSADYELSSLATSTFTPHDSTAGHDFSELPHSPVGSWNTAASDWAIDPQIERDFPLSSVGTFSGKVQSYVSFSWIRDLFLLDRG